MGRLLYQDLLVVSNCRNCPAGMFDTGSGCDDCAHTSASCMGNGFALVECGVASPFDVSACTNCASMGMFVSSDGTSCVASNCAAGEGVVAGGPGDTTCAECSADTFAIDSVCQECTATSANCGPNGVVFVGCGAGETSDVSSCTDCASMGMFVSGDGMSCVASNCAGGEGVVAGPPGDETCEPCGAGMFGNGGLCQLCEHTPETCTAAGFAATGCMSSSADDSMCLNCGSMGLFVNSEGTECSGMCSPGETVLAGAPGEQNCATCDEGTFSGGGLCSSCTHTAGSCSGNGFAVVVCGAGEGSDVSSCTNCTDMDMFVSEDGSSCIASTCPPDETVVAGPPGDMTCSGCPADTYQNGSGCVACAVSAGDCGNGSAAVTVCGVGETTDVSACMNCTELGMFVSGDGLSCGGTCSS